MIFRLTILAALIVAQPLANEDFLEPSVLNELDHAFACAPTNACAPATPRDYALLGTNGLSRTALAIRLVSIQRPDGRFAVGTNDVTAAALRLVEFLREEETDEAGRRP